MTFWQKLLALSVEDDADLAQIAVDVERVRVACPVKVGSIDWRAARALRALARLLAPCITVEIGTGLGYSTRALSVAGSTVYTCDRHDAGVPLLPGVTQYRQTSSTAMLSELCRTPGVSADLCFIDGRLVERDDALLAALSHAETVMVFDDYYRSPRKAEKGIANLELMRAHLAWHRVIEPDPSMMHNRLAALVPEALAA